MVSRCFFSLCRCFFMSFPSDSSVSSMLSNSSRSLSHFFRSSDASLRSCCATMAWVLLCRFFSIILHCMKRFSWLITTSASFVSQSSSWCCMFAFDCFFCAPFVVFNAVFFFFSTACAVVSVAFRKKRCCRGRALCWCFLLLH